MTPPPRMTATGFPAALAFLRQGDTAAAEATCLAILKQDPRHFDALHLAGMIATHAGRLDEGVSLLRRAKAINPRNATLFFNLGLALVRQGNKAEALASMEAALALEPNNADAAQHFGELLLQMKRPHDALAVSDRLIALVPDKAEAHCFRARALVDVDMLEEALGAYKTALDLKPNTPDYLAGIAATYCMLRRFTEGLNFAEKALAFMPSLELALLCQTNALLSLGQMTEALASVGKAVSAHPHSLQAHNWRSRILVLMGQPERALVLCAANQNIAMDDPITHINHGYVLAALNRLEEALLAYDRALKLKPDEAEAHYNRAFALLTLGRLEEGWLGYEYRNLRRKTLAVRKYSQPIWWGRQTLKDQRLFVYAEQGFGDTIQFSRYALMAAAEGAKPVLAVQNPLRRLFKDFDPGVTIIGQNEVPGEFDLHCPILSLPLAFGTRLETIPAWPNGYLKAGDEDVAGWAKRLPAGRRRIGLVWSGSTLHNNDANRSIPLAMLAPLLESGDFWISLQKEVRKADEPILQATGLLDASGELGDFADTAALIAALDLVIAVDTSVAHLAGALGKPTWLMLPFAADFRWLLKREDSPWYPNMRLFRQQRPGDWHGVIARVSAALGA